MATLAIAASITRKFNANYGGSAVDQPDLLLNVPGTYKITGRPLGFGPGPMSHRREAATSPYVDGRVLVSSVKDVQIGFLKVRVYGSSMAQLRTRENDLFRAFEQYFYDLGMTIDGAQTVWRCEAADWAIGDGGTVNEFGLMQRMEEVTLEIPHDPTPLAGPI